MAAALIKALKQEIETFQVGAESSFKVFLPIGNSDSFLCKVCEPLREIQLPKTNRDGWISHINSKMHRNQLKFFCKWHEDQLEISNKPRMIQH